MNRSFSTKLQNLAHSITGRALSNAIKAYLFIFLLACIIFLIMQLKFPAVNPPDIPDIYTPYTLLRPQSTISQLLIDPWYRWDSIHYLEIAEDGYKSNLKNTVWPPLYPLLIRVSSLLFPNALQSALFISHIACILALTMLYLLVNDLYNEKMAKKTILLVALFPTAFFLVAAYTESLFLLISLGIFFALRKEKWWVVAVLSPLAILTRFQGILLAIPILWYGFTSMKKKNCNPLCLIKVLISISLMVVTFSGYSIYVHEILNADWPWITLAQGWDQHIGLPWQGLVANLFWFVSHESMLSAEKIAKFYDLLLMLLAIWALIKNWKTLPSNLFLYSLFSLLLILIKIDANRLLVSASRYVLVIFPVFIALARIKKQILGLFWLSFSLLSQVLLVSYFYWWGWVA